MSALILLAAAGVYLLIMFLVMRFFWRMGFAYKKSPYQGAFWAGVGFLLVHIPVFKGLVPAVIKHRILCSQGAGFSAYIPKEEWLARHQGALAQMSPESLRQYNSSIRTETTADGYERLGKWGGLTVQERRRDSHPIFNLDVVRTEYRMRDAQTDQIMAVYVDYAVKGGWSSMFHPGKLLSPSTCFSGPMSQLPQNQYARYVDLGGFIGKAAQP